MTLATVFGLIWQMLFFQVLPLGGIPIGGGAASISALSNTCAGGQGGTTGSTVSCTWSAAPAAGSSLVCSGATWSGGTGTITAISFSDGTAFTNTRAIFNITNQNWLVQGYRFNIGTTAPTTITMTLTGGTDAFANILCNAFTDTGTPTADGTCTFATTVSTATSQCSAAIVTTGKDYVIGIGTIGSGAPTAGTGWTTGSNSGGAKNEYQVQTAAGSINPSFTGMTTGQNQGVMGFAVKP